MIEARHIEVLKNLLGEKGLLTAPADMAAYETGARYECVPTLCQREAFVWAQADVTPSGDLRGIIGGVDVVSDDAHGVVRGAPCHHERARATLKHNESGAVRLRRRGDHRRL